MGQFSAGPVIKVTLSFRERLRVREGCWRTSSSIIITQKSFHIDHVCAVLDAI